MRRTTAVFTVAVFLLLTLFLCGCPQSQKRPWWDDPLTAGEYSEGYQAGYNGGYLQGQTDSMKGQEMDDTPPRPDPNRQDEYNDGFSSGYKIGYKEGWNAKPEKETAYQDGYRHGFNRGAERGYTDYMSSKYEEGMPPDIYESSSVRGEIWHLGCQAGLSDGYNYGVLLARRKAEKPKDWYEDSLSSKVSREELLDHCKDCSLVLYRDADFDPHYSYELTLKKGLTKYTLCMYPKGGFVIVFEEAGTCELNESGESVTLNPESFATKDPQGGFKGRPEELKGVVAFKIEASKVSGNVRIVGATDSRGKFWENR